MKGKDLKPHIGIYGRRNVGKSSLINCLAGQEVAIVSETAGTTTDPVKKSYEITGLGPVIFIDTAGVDDEGELGQKRIEKTQETLSTIDLAILVFSENQFGQFEFELIAKFQQLEIPFLIVHNKSDICLLSSDLRIEIQKYYRSEIIEFAAKENSGIQQLILSIKIAMPETAWKEPTLIGDLVSYGDIVLLITPIDIQAPTGRLILPQVQTIRDILDNDCVSVVVKEREVDAFLRKTGISPKLAITDSQIFLKASASIPTNVPLTSFSIILARLKGDFQSYLKGTPHISKLKDGDKVLLLESCSHHVSCDDIGRVKIPRWLSDFTGKKLHYDFVAGLDPVPGKVEDYSLVIQCGGCMLTRRQVINRLRPFVMAGIPVTNYGMTIAYIQGIYERAVAPFVKLRETEFEYL
jgi:[FeFe] hydrogenase H-cluster maturation GTPase HydF